MGIIKLFTKGQIQLCVVTGDQELYPGVVSEQCDSNLSHPVPFVDIPVLQRPSLKHP
jgi:hypothetical protein